MRRIIVPVTICVQSGRGPFLLAFGHRLNLRLVPEYIVNESPRRRRLEAPERDQRHRAAQTVADYLKLRQLARDDLVAHRPGGQHRNAKAALDHSLDEEGVVGFERQVGSRAYLIEELIGRTPDRSATLEEYQLFLLYLRNRRGSLSGQLVLAAHDQRQLILEEFRHLQVRRIDGQRREPDVRRAVQNVGDCLLGAHSRAERQVEARVRVHERFEERREQVYESLRGRRDAHAPRGRALAP